MTYSEWDIGDDDTSTNSRFKCALGINKRTGRLQWCPGCKCVKMLVIVPATLLPILLVFFLLNHLELVGTVSHHHQHSIQYPKYKEHDFLSISNSIENAEDITDNRESKCIAVRYSMSETLDNDERDLMKDLRTSFIPPDLIYVPPNCKVQNAEWPNDSGKLLEVKTRESIEDLEETFGDFLFRYRRNSGVAENGTLDISEENEPQEPWKSVLKTGGAGNAEQEDTELTNPNDSMNEAYIPASVHAFWKGEGTPEQIRATQAEVMLKYMDESANPCEDFYQYACGNWEKLNPIPRDKAAYDTFEMLRENLDNVLEELLTSVKPSSEAYQSVTSVSETDSPVTTHKDNSPNNILNERLSEADAQRKLELERRILQRRSILDVALVKHQRSKRHNSNENIWDLSDAEEKAKNLYKSCMNYELLEQRGITPLLQLLEMLGGWPALDPNWNPDYFDWLNLTAKLRLFNNDIFLVEWIGADIKNSDENIIQFDQSSLGLPTRDYFLEQTNAIYLEAYTDYMRSIITLLGVSPETAMTVTAELVAFETELAKITSSPEERTNVSLLYNKLSIEDLSQHVPEIDWIRYLSVVLERPVNRSELVVMFAMDYMKNLVVLLSNTPRKTVANYLLWRFIRHRVNNLDDRFQDAKQKFYFILFGREQSPPRWKTCVNQVNSNMGMAVGAMFVRKYFDENSKKDTLDMTHELQQAFRELLNTTEWLDEPTRHLAELKVNAMTLRIGYPDFILMQDQLNEKYKDLSMDADKYFENTLNVLVHLTRTEQSKLGEPVNKTTWHTAPAVVNAYYSRNKNQIMFPAGILQPPFYHRHFPRSLNYGGIGVVIGHELTHGFDDKGRLFDLDGNLQRWWSDAAIESFHQRARCLVSQYSNYTVAEVGIPVDGENTQGENIADNGGIKQAFLAYKKWVAVHESNEQTMSNEVLTGINATNTQLFFLNFAQVWCGAMRPEATKNKLKTAVHSPGRFRVIGTLSNSEDFAKEYACPLGSPMNPEKKCRVW